MTTDDALGRPAGPDSVRSGRGQASDQTEGAAARQGRERQSPGRAEGQAEGRPPGRRTQEAPRPPSCYRSPRSFATANSRIPSGNATSAFQPSSARSRAESAVMWRTSPSRYSAVTTGSGPP